MPPESTVPPQVLRIARSDEPDAYVLLRVSRTRATALDLDIAATEGESPYTGSIRQSRLKSLCAKSYSGTDDEWAQIVSYIFGQSETSNHETDLSSGIEASATISGSEDGDDNHEMTITIRKRVETITQRLGAVTLKQNDDQAIELFDWTGIATTKTKALAEQFSSLNNRCRLAEDKVQQLNKQLEELIGAKSQHEEQLISNFAQLLNEKKLKIRNQQRLLASAKVDPEKVSEIQAATSGKGDSQRSRRPKRGAQEMSMEESESDDGFEKMEVDHDKKQDPEGDQETDDEQRSTPEPLEEEEADATTDDGSASSPVQESKKDGKAQEPSTNERPALEKPTTPPPRRELPFARRAQEKAQTHEQPHSAAEAEAEAGSTAGETDDDEL